MTSANLSAFPPDVPEGGLCVSASRLKKIGGEKGSPGCERRYVAEYLGGMKQSGSAATDFGSALHTLAEIWQTTGEVEVPESELGRVFRSGSHLIETCGKLLVEHEHVGVLPDGTPFVAYLDGHSANGGATNCIVIQDLKTCGNPAWALHGDDPEDPDPERVLDAKDLRNDLQAMFYAWIMLCLPHWYCPPLPAGHMGPKHWQWWDPEARGARSARLRWLYFLTKGKARAWDASDFVTPAVAAAFMQATIMPLVARLVALHAWHAEHPQIDLNTFDRNLGACNGRGRFCGAGERDACDFSAIGTPIITLRTKGPRPVTNPLDRLAALKARAVAPSPALADLKARASGAPAPAPAATPAPEVAAVPAPKAEVTPASDAGETSKSGDAQEETKEASAVPVAEASLVSDASAAPARKRGRPARVAPPSAAPEGPNGPANINPPESKEALAAMQAAAQEELAAAPEPAVAQVDPMNEAPRNLLKSILAVQNNLPVGVTVTIAGIAAVTQ